MKLSALDIRKQEFAKVFRGYDPEEVDSFRHMLSQQWHLLTEDIRRLENRIQDQNEKLEHYRKVEEALEEALQTARDGAKDRLEQAERKAQTAIQEAESKADNLVQRAEQRAQRMVSEAEEFRRQAKRTHAEARLRRDEIVSRLRAMLAAQADQIDGFEAIEEQRARLDPVDDAEDIEPPVFTAREPVYAPPAQDEAEEEGESFDFRDMADLEAEPVQGMPEGEAVDSQPVDPAEGDTPEEREEATGADEEIRKIRRILEDLDG